MTDDVVFVGCSITVTDAAESPPPSGGAAPVRS